MKGKLLLGLTIATLISANSFAYEIHKGKITNHKEWSTGTMKAVFKDAKVNMPNHKLSEISKSQTGQSYLRSFAGVDKVMASVGEPALVSYDSAAMMQNQTNSPQVFYYRFGVCLLTSPHTENCSYSYDEITLEPGGSAQPSRGGSVGTVFSEPGEYSTSASTLMGLMPANGSGHASNESISISASKIIITANKH